MRKVRRYVASLLKPAREHQAQETLAINQGRILTHLNSQREYSDLAEAEFRVFSQWGEDGIIQYLLGKMTDVPKTFIEFGVEDFHESNCRFLMMKDYWAGMVIDGSPDHIESIKNSAYHWMYHLKASAHFITRENIASILDESGFDKSCGILSVDIDGVDYHIYEALGDWRPAILIVEYNALFGDTLAVTVPYDPAFIRHEKHYSGLYWGASLSAFDHLAKKRGYSLVGVNGTSSNAFFVRNDFLWDEAAARTVKDVFRPGGFRDVRDESGNLSFIDEAARKALIADLPLVDVVSGAIVTLSIAG